MSKEFFEVLLETFAREAEAGLNRIFLLVLDNAGRHGPANLKIPEGPTRAETFVTRKITRAVAAIHLGIQDKLFLGNLDAKRDWGHARDYVDGMWRILQQPESDDYVLATGEAHTVREFVERAFAEIGIEGKGVEERGVDIKSGRNLVEIDPRYFRPTEVDLLLGIPARPSRPSGGSTRLPQLVAEMVASDLIVMKKRGRV